MLRVERTGVISKIKEQRLVKQLGTLRSGVVEGKSVRDIHLDTGSSRTMIHRHLVPEDSIKEGSAIAICCAHGGTVLYPMADVLMEVDGKEMTQGSAQDS